MTARVVYLPREEREHRSDGLIVSIHAKALRPAVGRGQAERAGAATSDAPNQSRVTKILNDNNAFLWNGAFSHASFHP